MEPVCRPAILAQDGHVMVSGACAEAASHRPPLLEGSAFPDSRLLDRIHAFRRSAAFDSMMKPIVEKLDEALKRKGLDPNTMPHTSLFGFARMPSIVDAISSKNASSLRMELRERADAVCVLRPDMLALGSVVKVLSDALHVRLERVAEWRSREGRVCALRRLPEALASLDVRGILPAAELRDALRAEDLPAALGRFRPGDSLVMVLTKVEPHCDYIGLSMRQSRIDERLARVIILGQCHDVAAVRHAWTLGMQRCDAADQPDNGRELGGEDSEGVERGKNDGKGNEEAGGAGQGQAGLDLNEMLHADALFRNPYAMDHMMDSYGICQGLRLFGQREGGGDAGVLRQRGYLELRQLQNAAWAQDEVRKGVQHASDRNYALAIKSYRSAIHLDAQNADAHVALGAAFANTQKYQQALAELQTALELDPTHVNAKRYLEATKAKVRQTLGPLADVMLRSHEGKTEHPATGRRVPPHGASTEAGHTGGERLEKGRAVDAYPAGMKKDAERLVEREQQGRDLAVQADRGMEWMARVMMRQKAAAEVRDEGNQEPTRKKSKREKKSKKKKEKRRKTDKKGKKDRGKGQGKKRKRRSSSSDSSSKSSRSSLSDGRELATDGDGAEGGGDGRNSKAEGSGRGRSQGETETESEMGTRRRLDGDGIP